MKTKSYINNSFRDLILNALDIYCQPIAVYCYAYRKHQKQCINLLQQSNDLQSEHHYYLFITCTDQTKFVPYLQQQINHILPTQVALTIILEQEDSLIKKARAGKTFYCNVLRNAECWYNINKPDNLEFIDQNNGIPEQISPDISYLKKQWNNRLTNAKLLLEGEFSDFGYERVLCHNLTSAMEQLYFGLIKLFLNYTPSSSNLNYLAKFVSIISPEIEHSFNSLSTRDQELVDLMTKSQNLFRYDANYSLSETQVGYLHDFVYSLVEIAENYVDNYFAQLE